MTKIKITATDLLTTVRVVLDIDGVEHHPVDISKLNSPNLCKLIYLATNVQVTCEMNDENTAYFTFGAEQNRRNICLTPSKLDSLSGNICYILEHAILAIEDIKNKEACSSYTEFTF